MAITDTGKIIRQWPMVPGIDFAGVVIESESPKYSPGDEVILTGWGIGEKYWGGFAELARVNSEWLIPKPAGLTLRQTMQIGTAGLTAMFCVDALQHEGVAASTGRTDNHDYLRDLGASEIMDREAVKGSLKKPLETQRWIGAVDTVGGVTLEEVLKATVYGGAVSACGLAGGADLCTTVYPFILRGVKLIGIESSMCPLAVRIKAWDSDGLSN